jgi:hypothetical protein
MMDLDRMLDKCKVGQWSVRDLDWTQRPREMKADDEIAIVQLFTDMAGIERLAGALFREQERRVREIMLTEPGASAPFAGKGEVLRDIFRTFIRDEVRHAQAAQMLADFYDVHHHKVYTMSPTLAAFMPHFIDGVTYLDDDVANAYITGGELLLDIALLRSINDYVSDGMSAQAMKLINRDESRHIAIDYFMVEYYASDEYTKRLAARPSLPMRDRARAAWTFANIVMHAKPFFRDVFFNPMERVDPGGDRMREAFKRFQLLGNKPGVADRPFGKFLLALQHVFQHPVLGPIFGGVASRLAGVEPEYMEKLNTDEELERAQAMSYEALADEALAVKGDATA